MNSAPSDLSQFSLAELEKRLNALDALAGRVCHLSEAHAILRTERERFAKELILRTAYGVTPNPSPALCG